MFYPQICKHQDLYRVDVVFDTYKEQSLKKKTRVKREKGVRICPHSRNLQCTGELIARGLPFLHFLHSWLYQVMFLSHVTKHTASKVQCRFDATSNVFSDLSQQPTLIQVQEAMPTIERFTVLP